MTGHVVPLEREEERERPERVKPLQPFFVLPDVPCPYLSGHFERKLLTELRGPQAKDIYDKLSRAGFRRSHRFAYRPACEDCRACKPVRIRVADFEWTRSLKRIRRRNDELRAELVRPAATGEQYQIFARYLHSRHSDGEMADMDYANYRSMLEQTALDTWIVEFRDRDGQLAAACLADWLTDGPSAVYSFFDPAYAGNSLGTYMVLWLIEEARRRAQPHVYLGYLIEKSPKMAYKARFQPLEELGPNGWVGYSAE